ncbi:MAG: hypothetical protein KA735_11295 [Burkholderiaceae bacterium]|nr:hypothetical protein [Burkholderiaceae bacterium]
MSRYLSLLGAPGLISLSLLPEFDVGPLLLKASAAGSVPPRLAADPDWLLGALPLVPALGVVDVESMLELFPLDPEYAEEAQASGKEHRAMTISFFMWISC